jgi:hypothetical protein
MWQARCGRRGNLRCADIGDGTDQSSEDDAAQRLYDAMAATLDKRIEAAARDLEMDRRPNKKTMSSLVNDLIWRHVVGH